MKQTLFMLTLVLTLGSIADSSAYAQNGKVGPTAKLTPNLVNLHAQHTFHLAQRGAARFISRDPLITSFNDRVLVDAVASGDVNVLKADLVSLGMQRAVSFGRVVSGELPIAAIPAAAGLASLRFSDWFERLLRLLLLAL